MKCSISLLCRWHQLQPRDVLKQLTDQDIVDTYRRSVDILLEKHAPCKGVSASLLSAEVLICEKSLDLSAIHAIQVLDQVDELHHVNEILEKVVSEIEADDHLPNYLPASRIPNPETSAG